MPELVIQVTEGGVTRQLKHVVQESLSIESILGQVVDTCEFTIRDTTAIDSPDREDIQAMSDVTVLRIDDDGRKETKIFAGLAAYISGEVEGHDRIWQVSCQDYTVLLDRTLVLQNYEAGYTFDGLTGDRAIIAAAFEKDALGANSSSAASEIKARQFVDQGLAALSQQLFRYSTLREILSQLAQYVGYDFYVDYEKELHYYYREDAQRSVILTDDTREQTVQIPIAERPPAGVTPYLYQRVNWKRDGTRVVNNFALFGDRLLSDAQVFIIASTGQQEYDLSYGTIKVNYPLIGVPPNDTIEVWVRGEPNVTLTAASHDGPRNSPFLVVSSGDFVTDGVRVGGTVFNITDQSWGEITGVTASTINAILREGTNNSWNSGDQVVVPQWIEQRVTNNIAEGLGDFDVLHDAGGKTLEFAASPPSGRYSILIRFTHNFVGGQIATNDNSVTRYGRVFSRRVIASDINSAQGLIDKLANLDEQYSFALQIATVVLDEETYRRMYTDANPDGSDLTRLRAGDWITFTNRVMGVFNKEMLIHRITTTVVGSTGHAVVRRDGAGRRMFRYFNTRDEAGVFIDAEAQGIRSEVTREETGIWDLASLDEELEWFYDMHQSGSYLEYEVEMRDWEVDII